MDDFNIAGSDDFGDSSSILHTPPNISSYPNLKERPSHVKPRALRRESSTLADCNRILTEVFGHDKYKGKQMEVVEAAVKGADVFVLAPTGMGKSICFQVPALADKHGLTLVVSPLLALMKDQVDGLKQKGVAVASLTSETEPKEKQEIIDDLASGHPTTRLLYLTPERLGTADTLKLLTVAYENKELNRLVVDEAHCISEWGHDFRADYRRLGNFRDRFPDVPIMALTATATHQVQEDVIHSLKMSLDHLCKVVHPFNRSNLYYEIRFMPTPNQELQMNNIHEFITKLYARRKAPSSGVIYCRTRSTCTQLANFLRRKGLNAKPYHRGIPSPTLNRTLKEWTVGGNGEGGVDVVCATIAFGLGINKGDVRYIIHYDLPKSFEGYYQETGRAGRDGKPARCILYYSREDALSVKNWVKKGSQKTPILNLNDVDAPPPGERAMASLASLINYAEDVSVCRHISVCRYFGEPVNDKDPETIARYCSGMCDVCRHPDKAKSDKKKLSPFDIARSMTNESLYKSNSRDTNGPSKQAVSAPGTTLGSTKRGSTWLPPGETENKKFKSSYAPALYTKSHVSLGNLKKPFKPPSLKGPLSCEVGSSRESARPTLVQATNAHHTAGPVQDAIMEPAVIELSNDEANGTEDPPDEKLLILHRGSADEDPCSPAVEDNDDYLELLDLTESQKIAASVRKRTGKEILHALRKVFLASSQHEKMWAKAGGQHLTLAQRSRILSTTTEKIEWSIFSFCRSEERYLDRTEITVDAVRELGDLAAWDGTDEDVIDIADILCSLTRSQRTASLPKFMGVLGLTPFLQRTCPEVIKKLPNRLKDLSGKTVVIDATLITQRLHFAPIPHPYRHVLGWYRLVSDLRESGVNAICVFDGKERNAAKARETQRRKEIKNLTVARGTFESWRLKRFRKLEDILKNYDTMDLEQRKNIFYLLSKFSSMPYEPQRLPSSEEAVPSDMWIPVPDFAANAYAKYTDQRDDFYVVPEQDLDTVQEVLETEKDFDVTVEDLQSDGTHRDPAMDVHLSLGPLVAETAAVRASVANLDPVASSSPKTSFEQITSQPASSQQTFFQEGEDADDAYPNLGHYTMGADPDVPTVTLAPAKQEVAHEEMPYIAPSSSPDVLELEEPPIQSVTAELSEPEKATSFANRSEGPLPDDLLDTVFELASIDPLVPNLPLDSFAEPQSAPKQDDLSGALTSLYWDYRRSLPEFSSIFSPVKDVGATAVAESDANVSDDKTDLVVSQSQAVLTREEGALWESLTNSLGEDLTELSADSAASSVRDLASRSEHIVSSYERRVASPTTQTYEECKEILEAMNISVIEAEGAYEAEALASALVHQGLADYVGSEDTDVLLYNAPLLRGLTTKKEKMFTLEPAEIRQGLNLQSHSQFVEFALLIGTDFSSRIKNMGPARALKGIKQYETVERLLDSLGDMSTKGKKKFDPKVENDRYLHEVRVARTVFASLPPVPIQLQEKLQAQMSKHDGEGAMSNSLSVSNFGAVKAIMRRYGLSWALPIEKPLWATEEDIDDEWSVQAGLVRRLDLESGIPGGYSGLEETAEPLLQEDDRARQKDSEYWSDS